MNNYKILFGFLIVSITTMQAMQKSFISQKVNEIVENMRITPEKQCNLIGILGRTLNLLSANAKSALCTKCSKVLVNNHPEAYKAICTKATLASEHPIITKESGTMVNPILTELKNLTIDDKASFKYIPIASITPGQLRYAKLNVDQKVKAALKKGNATKESNKYTYKYNNNTSTLAGSDALPVVLASFGPVLVDGHHDTLASIALGAPSIPVYVKKDLSNLSADDFWKQATQEGLVYPYTLNNQRKVPTTFSELENDPNRYFAALVARKCNKSGDPASATFGSPDTPLAHYPIWIKVGKDIPFIEFKISDVLNKHGIHYEEQWDEKVPEDFVEKARNILTQDPVPGLKLIPQRMLYTEIPNICVK